MERAYSHNSWLNRNMQSLRWMIATGLLLVAISASGQSLGRNNGIIIRLSQRGLSYATQAAVDELYDKLRNEPISDFSGSSDSISYKVWNVKTPDLTKPTFNLHINQNQGVSAVLNISSITVTGNFHVRYSIGWFTFPKTGNFSVHAGNISLHVALAVGRDATGRPTVAVRSCTSNIGRFRMDLQSDGLIGRIIDWAEGRIGRKLRSNLSPTVCGRVQKLVDRKIKPKLKDLKVLTELQDPRLLLDYALLQAPQFAANYIDTNIKGDVQWKGRRTGTPSAIRSSWPAVPGSSSRMVMIYLTDYIINAIGTLLHNDQQLSRNVTRNMVPSSFRPWLSLACPNSVCAGTLLTQLASQYPDGWMEASIRTSSPPRLTIGNNVINGTFSGVADIYVVRPSGQKIRAGSVTATMDIPLFLRFANNTIIITATTPRLSVSSTGATTSGFQNLLNLISQGFAVDKLNEIGRKGFDLPTYQGITFINPQIYLCTGVIAVSTDVRYQD